MTLSDWRRLQRTIGNRAARRLLARRSQRRPALSGLPTSARNNAPKRQIQRAFVEKIDNSGRFRVVGPFNPKVSKASDAAEDASTNGEFARLLGSPDYYDIDTWDSVKGTATKVEADLVGEQKEAIAKAGLAEERAVTLPRNFPEFVGDYAPRYIEEQGVKLRDLTTGAKQRSGVQVVMHALSEQTQAQAKDPEARLQILASHIEKASTSRQELRDETLTVFIAPEGYFGRLGETQNKLYSEAEYQIVVQRLRQISRKYPDTLIVGGAIHWKKTPAEDPGYHAGKYRGAEQVPEKHTAYTYVTSPVVHDGEVFLYNKHVATGGETVPADITQKMFMATHREQVAQAPLETVGFFKVGGLNIGIEICGDHGESVLRSALDVLFEQRDVNVDYHILIAAGQTPSDKGTPPSLKGNGWIIGVDQPGAKQRNYSVLEFRQGKFVSSKMQHLTRYTESLPEVARPKEQSGRTVHQAKGDDLVILDGVLKKIGGN